jgi:hypothetical protein
MEVWKRGKARESESESDDLEALVVDFGDGKRN